MAGSFRAGIDIGGTFTDIVLLADSGERYTRKVPSSVDDYARAIIDGLAALLAEIGAEPGAIAELLHGTTVASNAILEHKGASTGLITTKGFRDVLEIRNLRMPRLYDMSWTKPPPLVERRLRVEVDERVNAQGGIDRPLDPASVERAVRFLIGEGVEAIAVCLLHSYLNPAHEFRVKEIAARLAPGIALSVSAEVLPVINEYERGSTAVINAYVRPVVERYLSRLGGGLRRAGVASPLLLMQSNGGLTTAEAAAATPMHIIESGPAAGVVGVQALARRIGIEKAISFDMGGTTAKASLIENGEFTRATEYQVGAGIVLGSRLLSGAGYTLKVPAIDLAEVGAGGGSILWIDSGGALQVGPHSAGAVPGPVCYGQGGAEPTVTDANVVLGYLNPAHLVGGALRLDADKARPSHRRADRAAARRHRRGGGLRGASDRRIKHDPRAEGGVERARPRPARIRAGRVRRQRPDLRGWDGRGDADAAGPDPALGRRVLGVRAASCRGRVPFRAHPQAAAARGGRGGFSGGIAGDHRRARSRGAGAANCGRVRARADRDPARR